MRASYGIEYTTSALVFIQSLPRGTGEELFDAIERLAIEPRPKGSFRRGNTPSTFYIRIGIRGKLYRISYEIRERRLVIVVLRVKDSRVARGRSQ